MSPAITLLLMMNIAHSIACLAITIATSSTYANSLATLRTTLGNARSPEPISTQVEITTSTKGKDEGKTTRYASTSTVLAEDGPSGLKLGWTAAQMEAARKETLIKQTNKEAVTPNLDSLTALSAKDAAKLLNVADHLLQLVTDAELIDEKAETYQGKPATKLRIKLADRRSEDDKKTMKSYDRQFSVWVAADGTPLGFDDATALKGSKFFITFEVKNREISTLQKVGNRLIISQRQTEQSAGGLGMSQDGSTKMTVKAL